MRTHLFVPALVILSSAPLWAGQDDSVRQRWPDGAGRSREARQGGEAAGPSSRGSDRGAQGRQARERDSAEPRGARRMELPRLDGAAIAEQQREQARQRDQAQQRDQARNAQPRQRWPNADGQPRIAVPRPPSLPPLDARRSSPQAWRYQTRPQRSYRSYRSYGYPGYAYGYGYGSPSNYFYYYDPYPVFRYPGRSFTWYGQFGGYGFGYATGEIRLDVTPGYAQVYVDGYYSGIIDDFDGFAQGLRLEEGPYRIEIVADGYEPIGFDVRIQPGRRISYEADMVPIQ